MRGFVITMFVAIMGLSFALYYYRAKKQVAESELKTETARADSLQNLLDNTRISTQASDFYSKKRNQVPGAYSLLHGGMKDRPLESPYYIDLPDSEHFHPIKSARTKGQN